MRGVVNGVGAMLVLEALEISAEGILAAKVLDMLGHAEDTRAVAE